MKIEITGWSSKGFRCPDANIELQAGGSGSNVSLIQMPNGTGKTTTLELLRATLSGDIKHLSDKGLSQLARRGSTEETGTFSVKLRIEDVDYKIDLVVNFIEEAHQFYTTSAVYKGTEKAYFLPPNTRKFFTKQFLDLFLFDAEFQQAIFDSRRDAANSAIDALCQIYLLENIVDFANTFWRNQAESDTTRSAIGLAALKTKLKNWRKRRDNLQKILENNEAKIKENSPRLQKLDAQIEGYEVNNREIQEKLESTKEQLEAAKTDLEQITSRTLVAYRNIYSISPTFREDLSAFSGSLERNKLPEATSRQFFIELAGATDCICGRTITEVERGKIIRNADNYLGTDTAGIINAVKTELGNLAAYYSEDIDALEQDLKQRIRKLNICESSFSEAERERTKAGGDTLVELVRDRSKLAEETDKCYQFINAIKKPHDTRKTINDDKPDNVFSSETVKAVIDDLETREARITNTVDLKTKIQRLTKIIDEAIKFAREDIKIELLYTCNERLESLLTNDPIKIGAIGDSIKLDGQAGASAGQSLTVAYTFLMSLLERGGNQFPLIVDSPAGPLDRTVRQNVGALIPKICQQYIAFTINTEHPGFVTALEQNADTIKFLTLFRKTAGTERFLEALPDGKFSETDSGVLVDDKSYFDNFDMSDEV